MQISNEDRDGLTLRGLREFLARSEQTGFPDSVRVHVKATFGGKLRSISADTKHDTAFEDIDPDA